MSNAPTNVSEYDVIAKVVQHYIDGAKSGRGADMKPAFHKDATIFGARLLSLTGFDAGIITRETEKLELFVGAATEVEIQDVEVVTGDSSGYTPEDLILAILMGDRPVALKLSRDLRAAGSDAPAIISRLSMHFFDLKRAFVSGEKNPWQLARVLRLSSSRAEELCRWRDQLQRGQLTFVIRQLALAEGLVRSGRVEGSYVLDQLVLALAGGNSVRGQRLNY